MKQLLLLSFICLPLAALCQPPKRVDPNASYNTLPAFYCTVNSKLYFTAQDTSGREVWEYAETAPPKVSYNQIPGGNADDIDGIVRINNKMYWSNPQHRLTEYDGLNKPTTVPLLAPLYGTNPRDLLTFGSKIFFSGTWDSSGYSGRDLFSYDGINPPKRHPVTGPFASTGFYPQLITAANGKLYMTGSITATEFAMFVYDPATNILSMVPNAGETPGYFVAAGKNVYYAARDDSSGCEIWKYDGFSATRVTDLAPGFNDGARGWLAYFKGKLYFGGSATGSEYQLYSLDTAAGSTPVLALTVNPAGDGWVRGLFVYHDKLYFIGSNVAAGKELWQYDGSTGGILADIQPGSGSGVDGSRVTYGILNDHLYFGADDGVDGHQLWRYDDTSLIAGTGVVNARHFNGTITVYPNPSTSDLGIELSLDRPYKLQFLLSNGAGRAVLRSDFETLSSGKHYKLLPTKHLPAGTYFYRVLDENGQHVASGKVVKQ